MKQYSRINSVPVREVFRIYAATRDDINSGWVWLTLPDLPQRAIVRIENCATGKAVYCEALRIDENFLHIYNRSRRVPIYGGTNVLVANEWYRSRLGDIATQSEVELEVSNRSDDLGSYLCAAWNHPQVIVRTSIVLSVIGMVVGFVGVVLALVALYR